MNRPNNRDNPIVQERWYKTFLGQRQQHTYWLYKIIDDAVTANPQLERFVEIGTGVGALSVILALHAVQRGNRLLTFDNRPELHKSLLPVFNALNVRDSDFDHWTCLSAINIHMDTRPTFFFCDGGDKGKEFNFYTPWLAPGSVIAAHDYGMEFQPEDIAETVEMYDLKPFQPEDWRGGKDDIQTCLYLKP